MLPIVRVSTSILVFVALYFTGLFSLLLPLVSWLVNLGLLIVVSWAAGRTLANKYILPQLPKTDTKDKAVIVTGCDSGFGYLTALKLNKEGFHVVATVFDAEGAGAKKLKANANKKDRLTVTRLDVTKEEDISRLHDEVNQLLTSGGPVNQLFGLVNNAGILLNRGIEYAKAPSVEDFKRQFDVNVYGMVRMTRMFLPLLRKSSGRIVNIASQVSKHEM
jgi:NAD(P)-dependent dehydrogenase (short-subunit alcohol dehydrogenase family)